MSGPEKEDEENKGRGVGTFELRRGAERAPDVGVGATFELGRGAEGDGRRGNNKGRAFLIICGKGVHSEYTIPSDFKWNIFVSG